MRSCDLLWNSSSYSHSRSASKCPGYSGISIVPQNWVGRDSGPSVSSIFSKFVPWKIICFLQEKKISLMATYMRSKSYASMIVQSLLFWDSIYALTRFLNLSLMNGLNIEKSTLKIRGSFTMCMPFNRSGMHSWKSNLQFRFACWNLH